MPDITALGELLIDFTPEGTSQNNMPLFAQNPGGAPANVLVAASNLGMKTAFIGKVGCDEFANALEKVLKDYGVDTKGLVRDPATETTLAFVHLHPDGDRDFSFYRSKGADKFLTSSDIDFSVLDKTKVFHFGSLSLTDEPSRSTTFKALDYAVSKGKLISYDPNWRPPLWKNSNEGLRLMKKGLEYAHIVKMSEEELSLLAGTPFDNIPAGISAIKNTYGNIRIIAITMGKDGCYISKRKNAQNKDGQNPMSSSCIRLIPGITELFGHPIKAIDATGAGDCFTGALLSCILKDKNPLNCPDSLDDISEDALVKYAVYANNAAAFCVTKKGGIPSMPMPSDLPDVF